jgi:hypothetical protein
MCVQQKSNQKSEAELSTRLSMLSRPPAFLHKQGQVYFQQIKKKAKAEGKTCHAKSMLSLEQPIKLL